MSYPSVDKISPMSVIICLGGEVWGSFMNSLVRLRREKSFRLLVLNCLSTQLVCSIPNFGRGNLHCTNAIIRLVVGSKVAPCSRPVRPTGAQFSPLQEQARHPPTTTAQSAFRPFEVANRIASQHLHPFNFPSLPCSC